MADGGITWGIARPWLAKVIEGGLCSDDVRAKSRTDEAIKAILDEIIPVNGCMTADVVTNSEGYLLLPPEMENATVVEVISTNGKVNGQADVRQGWYDIVNPFAYVDPLAQHDNPLIDQYLEPDADDPTILRRKYYYPGLTPTVGAVVRVTGAKRFRPIVDDNSYLIVQNLLAIKMMILAIEKMEHNSLDQWKALKDGAIELLANEVKKHQLDPRRVNKRRAAYEADLLVNFKEGTMGYNRARLAFELPGGHTKGKSELTRLYEQAEQRLMNKGMPVGTIEEFHAEVYHGRILMPTRVKSVLAAHYGCGPLDIRSIFFKYQKNGPGMEAACANILQDLGEVYFSESGYRRRMYRLGGEYPSEPTTTDDDETTSSTSGTLTVTNTLYIGSDARYVAVDGGIALEVRDSNGDWIRQWTQTES